MELTTEDFSVVGSIFVCHKFEIRFLIGPKSQNYGSNVEGAIGMADAGGVWRTISGRRVFIRDGQSLSDAMRESGKFGGDIDEGGAGHITESDLYEAYDGLSEDEAENLVQSIRYYTDDYTWSLETQEEIDNLNKAIEEAKSVHWNEGELYRGINVDEDFLDGLHEGDVIETGLPSSWSSDVTIADQFASGERLESQNEIKVILVDTTQGARNAISIQDLSRFPDEQEVLYSGNSSFRVTGFREEESPADGSTIHMVEVEEVRARK